VRYHQKRVELAFQQGSKRALAVAYLGLADALLRGDEADRARAVYHRVLEHDPTNEQALTALSALEPPEEAAPEPAAVAAGPAPAEKGDFIDLGALILEDEPMLKDTRMRIEEEEPTGDEQRDFEEMLSEFKRGIEANLADEDWQAHYDLGVAFKEMGLIDEAITEFQKALRSPEGRLRTAEALGGCFYERGQYAVAATVLRRAVEADTAGDEEKIGLLYWLGRCEEQLGRHADALAHYQRVFSVDIGFQDVSQRVTDLAEAGS
jgi:tetratricopeptide (TPR) repeat protein